MRIRDHALNRLNVLKAIRRWGPVTRTELVKRSGLSGGSITQLTAELLKRRLITERRDTAKRNGRPCIYLEINARGGLVIGASLAGAGKLDTSFLDLMGNRLHSNESRTGIQPSLAAMAEAIGENLAIAIDSSPFEIGSISRVGIALPALVDSTRGAVHFMTTFPVEEPVSFADHISARLNLPVMIENDYVCMARAEHWFGRARDLETFTMVHVGFAIGSAHYEDGLPKLGASGRNTELGHVKVAMGDQARPCSCGARGCLSAYASMYGILKAADALTGAPFPPTASLDATFDQFVSQADAGDIEAAEALHQAGRYIGIALANMVNSTDPGNVLITFANSRFMNAIAEHMNQTLLSNVMPGMLPATTIELVEFDRDWRWKGTAALALEQTYLGST